MTNPHPLTEVELLPCPFCGGEPHSIVNDHPKQCSAVHAFVSCSHCATDGPEKYTEAEAIAAWNTRSTPAQPSTEAVKLADDDLLYLVKLADWAAGQGFCQIDGIEDPEEWCFRKWTDLGPPNGDGYSAEALADALRQSPPLPSIDEVRREAFEEALTPSGDTKAAYMGEFPFDLPRIDEAGDEYVEKLYVPWTTIKEIMAAIKARALSNMRVDAPKGLDDG